MELLKNLYSIHSMSGKENAMRNFIKRYVKDNIPGASCTQKDGNIYIVKGEADTYPCVAAHLDQVQTKHSPDFRVLDIDGKLFGFSAQNARQEGLGADDKNGIWVALKCLDRFDAIKVALFKEEEIGCGGSSIADMRFFADCRFVIEADRRNGGDLITDICGPICSDEFLADIALIAEAHGYKSTHGLMTDVDALLDNNVGVSCINFSCGYYNPHTDAEYTVVSELENCLAFAVDIINTLTKVYPFERKKASRSWSGHSSVWDDWYSCYDMRGSYAAPSKKESKRGYRDGDFYIPDFRDFPEPLDAVWSFVENNFDNPYFDPYTQFYLISADCDTYGIGYDDYCEVVMDVYEYYDECEYEDYQRMKDGLK